MKKSTKAILIASGVASVGILSAVAAHQISARSFMKIALDRKEPKLVTQKMPRLVGSEDFVAGLETLSANAKNLTNKNTERVELTAFDGITLVGHWYPCENAKRVIVAMHGWRSSWAKDFGIAADFFHENGCSVLFAEQRAHGESGGEHMGFGLLERYDCYEWTKWVDMQCGSQTPIYLMGISMGATTVMMTTSFKLPKNVKGVIADCGFTSPQAIWKHVAENNLRIPFLIYKGISNDIFKKKVQIGNLKFSTTMALEKCKLPVLFIHGTDDKFVPINMTFENYKACKGDKYLFIVPGAEHGMSYLVDTKGYEEKLLEFFESYDS